MKNIAVIVAAGRGKRFKGKKPKQFVKLGQREILAHAAARFEKEKAIHGILIIVPRGYVNFTREKIVRKYRFKKVIGVIEGGKQRYDSVFNGVSFLSGIKPDCVVIHDGARPVFNRALLKKILKHLKKEQAVIPVNRIYATVKLIYGDHVVQTLDRDRLRTSHTPQGFRYAALAKMYKRRHIEKYRPTDEAAAFEKAGYRVKIVEDGNVNIKVTTKKDLDIIKKYI